ncbi:MAG: cell division protein SepF [Lachnospiraceae bacterium]|nr:cell division protein SepF [Lachnospiraceae bacterium]MCR5766955.1 cell division protein SepF [Lachnospiraceae bacterium]
MAEFFKKLFDTLKMPDDDDAFDEYELENEKKSHRTEKKAAGMEKSSPRTSSAKAPAPASSNIGSSPVRKATHTQSNYGTSTYIEGSSNNKTLRMERPEGSKVVPLRTTSSGLEVCVMKPKSLEDSQDICDVLLSNCVAIVNLEENELALSQRIMDFISGAVYSINGKLFQISNLIFITAPGSVDVSGDYNDILAQSGFDVPILK